MAFDPFNFIGSLGSGIKGLFGHSNQPYDAAKDEYEKYIQQSQQTQKPYYDTGTNAMGQYKDWLETQKDPTKYINKLMGDYQESPYAKYLQEQSVRAGQNAASASGLLGSTPFAQQLQENATNIASGDMNKWLENVLGINTQYGQGQNNLMQTGQHAADQMSNTYNQAGQNMANLTYGSNAGKKQDWWNTIAGGLGSILSFF